MSNESRTPRSVTLDRLTPGACGVIPDLGEGKASSRLQSMGICLGRTVEIVKKGDPLILKVYGTRIGLSGRLASHIRLEPCDQAERCWERQESHG